MHVLKHFGSNIIFYLRTKALAYINSYFDNHGTQTNTLRLECNGTENNIADCNLYGNSPCWKNRLSGVWCSDGFSARLVNGSGPYDGRLEISLDGVTWGTVCDNDIGDSEAKFLCSMLGFPTNVTFVPPDHPYSSGSLQYVAGSIRCTTNDGNQQDCVVEGGRQCGAKRQVGIFCSAGPQYRLVDGSNPNNGRLEVSFNGIAWGTVCDDYFDRNNNAAMVACRSMGLPSSNARVIDTTPGNGTILLDNVECKGNELNILDCQHSAIGSTNCGHREDIGLHCE
ncbi:scavenger receptor cysteine-rich [Mactra antiquata]